MKEIIVLSCFNGFGGIGLALKQLGVKFKLYVSEIDKHANKVNSVLFPESINLGDVRTVDPSRLPKFDLVVGGSPCQGFSFAGKQLNFDDERSKLFFEFVRIVNSAKAKNPDLKFLLENVQMKKEYEAVISRYMGIDPIKINSALVSAQNRVRLYWTNIGTTKANLFGFEQPGIKQPRDKGIYLKDILELEVDEKYFISESWAKFIQEPKRLKKKYTQIDGEKAITMTARQYSSWCGDFIRCGRQVGRKILDGKRADSNPNIEAKQQIELRNDDKTNCLTTVGKDNLVIQLNKSKESGGKQPYQSNRVYSVNGKSPNLDTDKRKNILIGSKIRRLTPTECMRLQTVPQWAIEKMLNCGVSNTQLYKMLGNGWTIDVISYILSHEYKSES